MSKHVKVEGKPDGFVSEYGKVSSCIAPALAKSIKEAHPGFAKAEHNSKVGRETILQEAQNLTSGDRNKSYGPPIIDYGRATAIFNAATNGNMLAKEGVLFMVCVKLSREMHAHNRDNLVDACGYLRLLSMLSGDENCTSA